MAIEVIRTVDALFGKYPELSVYAVVDGASMPRLVEALDQLRPEHICLWRGVLDDDLEDVVPYLVRIEPRGAFTEWLAKEGRDKPWGVYAVSHADLYGIASHLRKLLVATLPDGKNVFFRFYDPRVLETFLPTCTPEELKQFHGPVRGFATTARI